MKSIVVRSLIVHSQSNFIGLVVLILMPLLMPSNAFCQVGNRLNFRIVDASNGNAVVNAYVKNNSHEIVAVSDRNGLVNIELEESTFWLVSHVSYATDTIFADALPVSLVVELRPATNLISEIAVTASRSSKGSVAALSLSEIKAVPRLLGEADPLRAALRIAGVESGGEVNSRLFVRGGLPGENLTLFDGIPIYNETHVGPLFSVFNADVLERFAVYKVAAPLEKGSGISALLEATSREPSFTKREKRISIGPVNSSFYLNRPWKGSNRTAFAVGLRGSPLSFLSILSDKNEIGNSILIELGDVNFSVRHRLSPNLEIMGRAFYTHDKAVFSQSTNFTDEPNIVEVLERNTVFWTNQVYSIDLQNNFANDWSFDAQLYAARYRYEIVYFSYGRSVLNEFVDSVSQTFQGNVSDLGARFTVQKNYANGSLLLGLTAKTITSLPIKFTEQPDLIPALSARGNSRKIEGYLNWEYALTDNTKVTLSGKANGYQADDYRVFLPTGFVALQRRLNNRSSARVTLERIAQFEHAFPAFGTGWQLNTWMVASKTMPAAVADRGEISIDYRIGDHVAVTQALYLRAANKLVRTITEDFTEVFQLDPEEAGECCVGEGKALNYGLETSLNYRSPLLNAGMNYTLARSENQFPAINGGEPFSPRFDRRHSFTLWAEKTTRNERWQFNAQFVYQSGIAFTAPVASIPRASGFGNLLIFDQINNARFPPVHRLDFNVDHNWIGKNGNSNTISFGVFNAYNRSNPVNFSFWGTGRIPLSPTRFPIMRTSNQPFVEGTFGAFPYIAYAKVFSDG